MSKDREEGGAAYLKGLRLLTMDRGPEGYGFHMYTNKTLKGQYVKWVSPNGPADLAGLIPGDHVLQVDEADVRDETHIKVVEKIRSGDGKGKKILVVDNETEKEMFKRGEEPDPSKALVMISHAPIKIKQEHGNSDFLQPNTSHTTTDVGEEETDHPVSPLVRDMSAAIPPKNRRAQVKNRDWRSSIQAYNEL